jgi:hypothetical protein
MRYVIRLLLTCAAVMAAASGMAQTVTPASAAASAAEAAPTPNTIKSWLTLTEQQDKFGAYTAGANEPRFAGGKGDARPDGTTRKAGCAGSTTDPECLAIQSLQNARASPSTWVAPNSPQLSGRKAVVSNPEGVLGFDPVAAAGASASVQCNTETVLTPEVREENHCVVSAPNAALTCSLGVEIEVDPDYVYKCLTRTATNSSTACSVGQVVTVDSTTTYQCVERLRSNLPNACTAKRIVEVDADTNYQCVNQVREASDTQCTVGSIVEVRADTNYQCVEQARTVANAACTVGQVVTIDPHFNYSCTSMPNAVTSNTCARKLTVDCGQSQCGGLSITPAGLPPGVTFEVTADWPKTDQSNVNIEFFDGIGSPAGAPDFYYFEFDLFITGTVTPVSFVTLSHMDIGSYVAVNGETYMSSGAPSAGGPNAFTAGINHIGVYYRVTQSGELPRIALLLQGSYCLPPVCTDTWNETECAPYKDRS